MGRSASDTGPDASSGSRGIVSRLLDVLAGAGLEGAPRRRLVEHAHRVRLGVGLVGAGLVWLLPATRTERILFLVLLVGVYVPYSLLLRAIAGRRSGPWVRVGQLGGDLLVVFLFQLMVPPTRVVALFGYLLLAAYAAYVGGLSPGLFVAGASLALTAGTLIADPGGRVGGFELGMLAVVLVSLVWISDAASREQRLALDRIARLHGSLQVALSSNDFREMLDTVAAAAKESFDALFAAVLLREDDALMSGAIQGVDYLGRGDLQTAAVASDDAGPSAIALATGERVVVRDIDDEPRFSRWTAIAAELGFASMVATPLTVEGAHLGVLNVYFARPRQPDRLDLELLQAHADQAAIAIARALAYEREKAAAEQLRELDQMRSEFLSTVSHELRSPLTALQGLAGTLSERWIDMDESRRREFSDRIARNATEMSRLVDQLLDSSRLDAEGVQVEPRRMDLRAAIERTLDTNAEMVVRHRVVVEVRSEEEVHADPEAFERILGNLVTNAAKYSPPGSTITVTAEPSGFDVVIGVTDRGPGIPEAEQRRVFDRYFRGSGPSSRSSGTGLGLSIARRYVELHGGRIWVESEEGAGATFLFTLPRAYVAGRPPRRTRGD